jgi:hypothetical protein
LPKEAEMSVLAFLALLCVVGMFSMLPFLIFWFAANLDPEMQSMKKHEHKEIVLLGEELETICVVQVWRCSACGKEFRPLALALLDVIDNL